MMYVLREVVCCTGYLNKARGGGLTLCLVFGCGPGVWLVRTKVPTLYIYREAPARYTYAQVGVHPIVHGSGSGRF
jgi:hypothetical protein